MKSLMISTTLAAGLVGAAMMPATATNVATPGNFATAPNVSNVDCRTVERRTTRNGVTRIEKSRECDDERRVYRDDDRRYVDRRDYRRDRYDDERPGINLRLGN